MSNMLRTDGDEISDHKKWYDANWLGDQEHGQYLPLNGDKNYTQYMDGYMLSLGSWMACLHNSKTRIAELEKDAGRYRWLRHRTKGEQDQRNRQSFDFPDPHPVTNLMRGSVAQHLDLAIDTAMENTK